MNKNRQDDINRLCLYIKELINNPQNASLDVHDYSEEFEVLIEGLTIIQEFILENESFVRSLARGELDVEYPSSYNKIAAPAKSLHTALSHLTWQAHCIAEGDYNQKVEFLGDFSKSFNRMIESLKESKKIEEREKALIKKRNDELQQSQSLIVELITLSKHKVVVLDFETDAFLFTNINVGEERMAKIQNVLSKSLCNEDHDIVQWEYTVTDELHKETFYTISSHYTMWSGRPAVAHLISDVTDEKLKEIEMSTYAYRDSLTGLYNRRYAMEVLEHYAENNKEFIVAFCDIDHLKYCNDVFGHEAGNQYIHEMAECLLDMPFEKDICRIGGDEFIIITLMTDYEFVEQSLLNAQEKLKSYPKPEGYINNKVFSFGLAKTNDNKTVKEVLSEADRLMYKQKLEKRVNRTI